MGKKPKYSAKERYLRLKKEGLCPRCRKPANPNRVYCAGCYVKIQAATVEYRKTHQDQHRKANRAYGQRHMKVICERSARRYRKCRQEIITHYGAHCVWCGETNPIFLTIDHVNDDGAQKQEVEGTGTTFFKYIKDHGFPPDYQILCYNCNCAKEFSGLTKADFEAEWVSQIDRG